MMKKIGVERISLAGLKSKAVTLERQYAQN